MIEYLSNIWFLLIASAAFGLFTKLADLCAEHNWKPFRNAGLLFGFLWGIFGALVVVGSPLLGSVYLAIVIHWIVRNKIDNINHGIAVAIILISFIAVSYNYQIDLLLFASVFLIFMIFGLLRDKRIIGASWFTRFNIYAYLLLIVFTIVDKKYSIVLISYFLNTLFYQIAKRLEHGKK